MTITVRGVNNAAGQNNGTTTTAGTASITPTLPTGTSVGDRVYVFQVHSGTAAAAIPSGWTVTPSSLGVVQDTVLGTGTVAAGSGLRRATWYWRDYDGVWTMPAFAVASATNNSHWIGAISLTPTVGFAFDTPEIVAPQVSFNGASTSYVGDPGTAGNNPVGMALAGSGFNDNVTSTNTATALQSPDATYGTTTERCDGGTATGNDVAGKIHSALITVGSGGPANAASITLTLSAASQGNTIVLYQPELAATPTSGGQFFAMF